MGTSGHDVNVRWSPDLERRPSGRAAGHCFDEQPRVASEELLGSWCQRHGVAWLAKTLENAGYRNVGDLIRADFSDDALRAIGVSTMSERQMVLDALANVRRGGISLDIINSAISNQSLETRIQVMMRKSEREQAEQQMRQARQKTVMLPSLERQRQQQRLAGRSIRLALWLQPLNLHSTRFATDLLRRAGINTVSHLLEANCSEKQLQGFGFDKASAADLAAAIQLERLSNRSNAATLAIRQKGDCRPNPGCGAIVPQPPSGRQRPGHGPRNGAAPSRRRHIHNRGTARRARERALAATARYQTRMNLGGALAEARQSHSARTGHQSARSLRPQPHPVLPQAHAMSPASGTSLSLGLSTFNATNRTTADLQGHSPIVKTTAGPLNSLMINISNVRLPPMRSLVAKPPEPEPEPEPGRRSEPAESESRIENVSALDQALQSKRREDAAVMIQKRTRGWRGRLRAARCAARQQAQRGMWTRSCPSQPSPNVQKRTVAARPSSEHISNSDRMDDGTMTSEQDTEGAAAAALLSGFTSSGPSNNNQLARPKANTDSSQSLVANQNAHTQKSQTKVPMGGENASGERPSMVSPTVSEDGFEYREVNAVLTDEEGGSTDDDDNVEEDLNTSMRNWNRSIMSNSFRTDGGWRGLGSGLGDTFRSIGFSTAGSDTSFDLKHSGTPRKSCDGVAARDQMGSAGSTVHGSTMDLTGVDSSTNLAVTLAIEQLQKDLRQERRNTLLVTGRLDNSERAVADLQTALTETQVQLAQTQATLQMISTGHVTLDTTPTTNVEDSLRGTGEDGIDNTITSLATNAGVASPKSAQLGKHLAADVLATKEAVTKIQNRPAGLGFSSGPTLPAAASGPAAIDDKDASKGDEISTDGDSDVQSDVWPRVV